MLELILITSLKILGIHVSCWQGMILGADKGWMKIFNVRAQLHFLPEWIKKPLYMCVICMASVWGTFFWLMDGRYICIDTLWFILAIAGINSLLSFALSYSPYNPINQDIG